MSRTEPGALLEQYRAGLEAELVLLQKLRQLAVHQRESSQGNDLEALRVIADQRDALMAGLMAVEEQVRAIREPLSAIRDAARREPGFADLARLHDTVTRLVREILETDGDSIRAMEHVVLARRAAAQALEQGESTLAAYGRVAAAPSATLVDRRG